MKAFRLQNLFLFVRSLLAYLFIPILEKELAIFKDTIWSSHRIRKQAGTFLPDGVPDHIYSFPEEYGLEECGMYCLLVVKTRELFCEETIQCRLSF